MSAQIPLSKGRISIVDAGSYDFLMQWKWFLSATGYAKRNCSRSPISLMHRLIIGARSGQIVDHINGDPLDNRKSNLRLCSQGENVMNQRRRTNNTSGFKGVSFSKDRRKWVANIQSCGRFKFLGYYATPEDAHAAYVEAAKRLHGEFARFE